MQKGLRKVMLKLHSFVKDSDKIDIRIPIYGSFLILNIFGGLALKVFIHQHDGVRGDLK